MEEIKTVHYVSCDQISNLKVKVVLTRIAALRRRPKYEDYGVLPPGQDASQSGTDQAQQAQMNYPSHPLDAAGMQYPFPPAAGQPPYMQPPGSPGMDAAYQMQAQGGYGLQPVMQAQGGYGLQPVMQAQGGYGMQPGMQAQGGYGLQPVMQAQGGYGMQPGMQAQGGYGVPPPQQPYIDPSQQLVYQMQGMGMQGGYSPGGVPVGAARPLGEADEGGGGNGGGRAVFPVGPLPPPQGGMMPPPAQTGETLPSLLNGPDPNLPVSHPSLAEQAAAQAAAAQASFPHSHGPPVALVTDRFSGASPSGFDAARWQQHQQWQAQQAAAAAAGGALMQQDPLTGQWVSMAPLLPGDPRIAGGMIGPDGRPLLVGPDGLPLPGYAAPSPPPPGGDAPDAPERLTISRVFAWQEKVLSRNEVAAMLLDGGGASRDDVAGGGPRLDGVPDDIPGVARAKRHGAIGSEHHLRKGAGGTDGSVLFTYVNTDDFAEREEFSKTVTTSEAEKHWPLFRRLMGTVKGRQQVLNFRTMYIMADLADEHAPAYINEKVLVAIKAHSDGSFDMRPGFSKPGCTYRFEDAFGGLYEYCVENASDGADSVLAKRAAKLQRSVVSRAERIRRAALRVEFEPPPPDDATRLLLLGEVLAVADFDWDNLYVEFMLRWDPEVWDIAPECGWEQCERGVVRGVTHNARVCLYPNDPVLGIAERWVGHFAHPFELALVSRPGAHVAPNKYPVLLMQVCQLTRLNRYTSEGYGWVSLSEQPVPGSATHACRMWKPCGTMRDKLQEFFVGGSQELEDMAYMMAPHGSDIRMLNKFGFKTETTGLVKVRMHAALQRAGGGGSGCGSRGQSEPGSRSGSPPGARQSSGGDDRDAAANVAGAAVQATSPSRLGARRLDPGLDAVLARAKSRLRDARGGELLLRPGITSEAPLVRLDPAPLSLPEGGMAQFKVAATGVEPLRYQWFKDDKKITIATADTYKLIIAGVGQPDEGLYYCQVSNKDGTATSGKAMLKVERASRLLRAGIGNRSTLRSTLPPTGADSGDAPASPLRSRVVRKSRLATPVGDGGKLPSVPGADGGGGLAPVGGADGGTPALPPLQLRGLEVDALGDAPAAAPQQQHAPPATGALAAVVGTEDDVEVETLQQPSAAARDATAPPLSGPSAPPPADRPAVRTGFADGGAAAVPAAEPLAPSEDSGPSAAAAALLSGMLVATSSGEPASVAALAAPRPSSSSSTRQRSRMSSSGGGAPTQQQPPA